MTIAEHLLGMRPRPPRSADVRDAVSGRIVVVTGASRGIGAETARRLGQAGAHVVLIARSADALADVAEAIRRRGGTAHVVALDLRDTGATEEAARRILAEIGVPSVVVSNAGLSIHRTLVEYTDRGHDVTRSIGVNYLGPVALLRVLIPAMRLHGGGTVVSVSSVSAVVPSAGWSVYGASKAASDAWFSAVAQEVEPDIAISIVRLPLVRTKMSRATASYAGAAAMRPIDAAAVIARALVTRRRVIAPWWLTVAGGLLAVWPTALDQVLTARERRARR